MKNQFLLAVALLYVTLFSPLNNDAHAWQSGSRSGSGSAPQSVLTESLQQGFAQPSTGTIPQTQYAQPQTQYAQPQVQYAQPQVQYAQPQGEYFQPQSGMPFQGEVISEVPMQSHSQCASDSIWAINQPGSNIAVDHSIWNCFLSRYVITDNGGLNRLRYRSVTGSDRHALQRYLQQLQSTDVRSLNKNEQLAFWLNFYNAQTVETVLARYPVRSIRQIKTNPLDVMGPFDDPAVTVLGQTLSLSDIENKIVRANWDDPRIHYALNCASYGCPNLARTAWQAYDLDARLNHAATSFINSGRAVKVGPLGGTVAVSKIFKWYKDDFGGSDEAVLAHIRQYAFPQLSARLNGRSARVARMRLLEPLIR